MNLKALSVTILEAEDPTSEVFDIFLMILPRLTPKDRSHLIGVACEHGKLLAVQALCQTPLEGAYETDPVEIAVRNDNRELLSCLLEHGYEQTSNLLVMAIKYRATECIPILTLHSLPDHDGYPPYFHAFFIYGYDHEITRLFTDLSKIINHQTTTGNTLLSLAVTRFLTDPSFSSDNEESDAESEDAPITLQAIEYLLNNGSDPSIPNNKDLTAFQCACKSKVETASAVVELLLFHDASLIDQESFNRVVCDNNIETLKIFCKYDITQFTIPDQYQEESTYFKASTLEAIATSSHIHVDPIILICSEYNNHSHLNLIMELVGHYLPSMTTLNTAIENLIRNYGTCRWLDSDYIEVINKLIDLGGQIKPDLWYELYETDAVAKYCRLFDSITDSHAVHRAKYHKQLCLEILQNRDNPRKVIPFLNSLEKHYYIDLSDLVELLNGLDKYDRQLFESILPQLLMHCNRPPIIDCISKLDTNQLDILVQRTFPNNQCFNQISHLLKNREAMLLLLHESQFYHKLYKKIVMRGIRTPHHL
jgi:hypothetical protein